MTDPRTPVDELRALSAAIASLQARLDILEAPSGTQAFRAVAQLTLLVADIQNQLNVFMAGKYTNSQIDAKDAVVNANISTTISSVLAGNVTVGGAFRASQSYGTDITYTRRAAWVGNDGQLGYASSSRVKKTAIEPAEIDVEALLSIEPKSFYYREEIRRRTRRRINDGEEYFPKRELGFIAEDLDDAGLDAFVIYDEDGSVQGIEYSMLVVAQQAALRSLAERITKLEG